MKDGKQPWLKFYPTDWRAEPTLRVCSLAARGLWVEMLGIMHDAEPRGSLLVGGREVTLAQLANLVGAPQRIVIAAFNELDSAGVFSRDDDTGTIFSRRIRKDIAKAEQDKANGKTGGNPNLKPKTNRGVNPQNKTPDKAQKPEARGQIPEAKPRSSLRSDSAPAARDRERDFDRFWQVYPKRTEQDDARRALDEVLDEGRATIDEVVDGARRFAPTVTGREDRFIASPVRWLQGGRWKDGQKPNGHDTAPASVFVRGEDPRFKPLAERYKRAHGSSPKDIGQGGRAFPSAWVAELEPEDVS